MKHFVGLILSAVFAVSAGSAAFAGEYPQKPIRLVVPFAPGGSVNLLGRILADRLSASMGAQVVVENRAGAGGLLGADIVAKAPSDGYTLLLATMGAQSILPAINKNLPFDPKKDFTPIGMFASLPNVLVVSPQVPAASVGELIAYSKANPGKLNMASAGLGSVNHMVGELFMLKTGSQFLHVPYKGAGPAIVDLLGNRVQLAFVNVPGVLSYIESGQLKALGLVSAKRSGILPEVPTMMESGACDCVVDSWYGVMGPKDLPQSVVDRLSAEIAKLADDPAMRKQLTTEGGVPLKTTPAQFASVIRADADRWAEVVADAKLAF